jgi:hypothetical protein
MLHEDCQGIRTFCKLATGRTLVTGDMRVDVSSENENTGEFDLLSAFNAHALGILFIRFG